MEQGQNGFVNSWKQEQIKAGIGNMHVSGETDISTFKILLSSGYAKKQANEYKRNFYKTQLLYNLTKNMIRCRFEKYSFV